MWRYIFYIQCVYGGIFPYVFVIVYKLFNGDAEATGIWVSLFGCLGALGTTFIVIPVVAWLSKKMGKKKHLC